MNKLILLFACLITITCSFGQGKRGIAYGYHSPSDLDVLSPEISWWYNWSEVPESSVASVFTNYNFEFVPMTWNGLFDETKLRNFLINHPETKYLLAFNEPNFLAQANMTPSQVAALWPVLESIADDHNLEIVGPAVNYCGDCVVENNITYNDPFQYLDDFFAACPGCQVDHIAVHSYMNTVPALSWYVDEFKQFGKPIWLTEFAGWEPNGNINNISDQINFMVGAVDFLEANPDVMRYSWFIGRGDGITNYPFIDLLGADGVLTELGEVYKQMPVHDENNVVQIPAVIEAEAYNKMYGISLELTEDESGFANVGWIDAGDWLEYKIDVPSNDFYDISFRIASTKFSALSVVVDGNNLLTKTITDTGGWQNWITFEDSIELNVGEHEIRLLAASDGFNVNWFQIGDVSAGIYETSGTHPEITMFPNPANDLLNVVINDSLNGILRITDISGKNFLELSLSNSMVLDISMLSRGIYFVLINSHQANLSRKLIIQ